MPRGDRRGQRDAVTVTCEEAAGVGAEHRVCSRVIRGQCAFQLIVVRALTSPSPSEAAAHPLECQRTNGVRVNEGRKKSN